MARTDSTLIILTVISACGLFYLVFTHKNKSGKKLISSDEDQPTNNLKPQDVAVIDYPIHIKKELFSRVMLFFGLDGLSKLQGSFVIVVGLGGVGSHAANMLVRSGVNHIRMIDFDQVSLSSLNRHALANIHDVGIPKVEAMKRKLLDIVPWCNIEAIPKMFKNEDADTLLNGNPDYVLDCIDDISTKAELIVYCKQHNIPVLASSAAGGKSDPTRLRIAVLNDCINDPLASKIKWKLKKHGISGEEVTTVFSIEKPVCNLLPLDEEQQQSPQDYGAVDYLRIRIMPVLGTSPSMFGQSMASYVLCQLAGKPYEPEVCERISKHTKHKLRQLFRNNEIRRFKTDEYIDLDDDDLEFVVQQVWRSRCAVTQKRFGGHLMLTLTRWNPTKSPSPYNLVLLMQNECEKLETIGHSAFSEHIVQRIESRLEYAKNIFLSNENFS